MRLISKFTQAFLPLPNGNVRAKCHLDRTLCSRFKAFRSKGSTLAKASQNLKNRKDPFCLRTIEIPCTDLCDFWTKLLEVLSKNVFLDIHCKQWSDGPKMSSVQPMSSLINPVSVALLFNPFGDVEVIIRSIVYNDL